MRASWCFDGGGIREVGCSDIIEPPSRGSGVGREISGGDVLVDELGVDGDRGR
jgi:hypothetical protein